MSEYTVFDSGARGGMSGDRVPLAMAYVRDQDWERPLSARDALRSGTAFGSLAKPFVGAEVDDEKQC